MDWNSGWGIGTGGIYDQVGGNLATSPFGGYGGLSVGGSLGSSLGSSLGGAAGGISPGLGFLTAANSALAGMQQSNLNQAAANNFAAQNAMFDANFGKDIYATSMDRFRSLNDPIRAGQIAANVPGYRQGQLRTNLPELAGKYGSFGAFVS
jgi:hypothetical protein